MNWTVTFGAIGIVALTFGAGPAGGADRQHKFFYSDYDPSHCWGLLTSKTRTAPAFAVKNPGAQTATESPGVSLLGEDISPMGFDPQLAVSPTFVLVREAHQYVFYDRATNQALAANGCVPVNAEFTDLFAPLL